MRAIIKCDNKIKGRTDFPILPRYNDKVRLRNGETYRIKGIAFVESTDVSEMDYIGHIELDCIKL